MESVSLLDLNGNTETGIAGTVSQRSFKNLMNFITVSFLNSSSLVNISNIKKDRIYLKGTKRRTAEPNKSTIATSVVI